MRKLPDFNLHYFRLPTTFSRLMFVVSVMIATSTRVNLNRVSGMNRSMNAPAPNRGPRMTPKRPTPLEALRQSLDGPRELDHPPKISFTPKPFIPAMS